MALRAVNPTPPARSAEREALALAIEKLRTTTAERAALNSAVVTADSAVRRCVSVVETAKENVEKSQSAQADFLLMVAQGIHADAPPSTRAARDRLQDAEDDLSAARAAVAALRQRQSQSSDDDLSIWRMQLRERAAGVLQSEFQGRADALVTTASASLAQLIEVSEFVRRLSDARLFARNSLNQVVGPVGVLIQLSDLNVPDGDAARARGAERFAALFDGLLLDADAVLPG